MSPTVATDGSARADAHSSVEIDVSKEWQAWRYRCPNGHSTIEETNGGIWCRACSRDGTIDDPHHHTILDVKTGEEIPWSAVELVGDE